ncbi:Protein crossbronx-like protein [Apiospora marii]|uniref:Protein crossbronx-like protein n=2 Tax=Apiospora marii TaxID=335849 RepID=A0ABR1SBB4_9PEZI
MNSLPALRKQNLLVEFSGLKQSCPEGIFVSLTPGDPALWSGVVFVRDGPYAPAVMRFQISFPDAYPQLPPLVTFSTDMFHPLITPLTTYMYSTDVQDNGTVSATDEERLPPGGFSLRHGFPDWFQRRSRSSASNRPMMSGQPQQAQTPPRQPKPSSSGAGGGAGTPGSRASAVGGSPGFADTHKTDISTFEVLRYIRSTFDDEAVLDAIPLEAAGNPGAWHAWRTHRHDSGKVFFTRKASTTTVATSVATSRPQSVAGEGGEGGEEEDVPPPVPAKDDAPAPGGMRQPGEWNWEGVWEARVKKGVDASVSEAVLYGGPGVGDDVIRFLSMEEGDVEAVKENLLRTLEHTATLSS